MPPEPTVIWMVREGDPTATEGTLSLDDAILRFTPKDRSHGEPIELRAADIRKARRARMSPFMSLTHSSEQGVMKLYVYFSKPPPLPSEKPPGSSSMLRPRGLERSAAALSLRDASRLVRSEIESWVRELRRSGAG